MSSFWDGMVEWAYTLHFWWKKQYADSMLSLQNICLQYFDGLAGAVATLRLHRLDFLHHVQSFRYLAEYRVLSVQVWSAADGRVCLHLLLAQSHGISLADVLGFPSDAPACPAGRHGHGCGASPLSPPCGMSRGR